MSQGGVETVFGGGADAHDTSMNQSGTFNQFNGLNADNSESITNI